MIKRPFWLDKVFKAWQKRSIVWLSGVRRVGKTTIAKMIDNSLYLNCDLPSVCRRLSDPESFYNSLEKDSIIILDEIHKTEDPSRILKIASDAFAHLKILATGSSTLAATKKFRDSLTGRKTLIHLFPVLWDECQNQFSVKDLDKRLLFGGLPEVLFWQKRDPEFYSEWIDSFYARDIQELFAIRNRTGFLKLFQLLLRQSGSLTDFTNLAKLSGLSRPTVMSHIEAMSIANALVLLPPFHGGGRREITQRPKCYTFDTGFIAYMKGWNEIREEDRGILWEHIVLDVLRTSFSEKQIYYWRDKAGREIDFVIKKSNNRLDTIECKIDPDKYSIDTLKVFRGIYPLGENYVISPRIKDRYVIKKEKLTIRYIANNTDHLADNEI